MLHYVVSEAGKNEFVESLGFAVCCEWYAVTFSCLAPNSAYTVVKNLLSSWVSLSVRKYVGMAYGMSQWSANPFATSVVVVFDVKPARFSSE